MSYRDDIYISVKRSFDENAQKARREADEKRRRLSEKYPDMAEVEAELSQTALSVFKAATDGRASLDEKLAQLKERNRELLLKRSELLKKYGYPQDYFMPAYRCEKCSDTGTFEGKMCVCMKNELTKRMTQISGLGILADKMTFENFDLSYYVDNQNEYENMQFILGKLKEYVESFSKENNDSLLLIGTTGTGKTHLSVAVAADVIKRGYYVIYNTAQNVFADFEYDKFKRSQSEPSRSEKYFDCELLVIDDLGTENVNQFTTSCLYNLVNTRYCEGKAMIINTNLSHKELRTKYDDRIFSRLAGEFKPFVFTGKDIRLKKLLMD